MRPTSAWTRRRAGLGLLTWPLAWSARAAPATLGEPVVWPALTLLGGQQLPATAWQGQVVVVVFFATDCPYCQRHNTRLEQLVHATRGQGLQVLGVAGDRDPDRVRAYLDERGLSFPVTLDSAALHAVLSPRRVIPLTCVIDRAGRLREVIPGEMSQDDVLGLARWLSRA